jgi:hypothetical protein
MSDRTPAWETNKAFSSGISFNPGTLYGAARAYGLGLTSKLGVSDVVCQALTEFLTARGALSPVVPAAITAAERKAIDSCHRLGLDPVAALTAAAQAAIDSGEVLVGQDDHSGPGHHAP